MIICPNCSAENPEGFRFCGKCGTRLEAEIPAEQPAAIEFDSGNGNGSGDNQYESLPPHVLVVDDEPHITQLLKNLLELEGIKVESASNVADAMSLIEKEKPSLIITDIMMPDMDGYSFIRQLRKNPETQKIKIIVLTVLDAFEEIRKSVLLGADDYISKPFDPQELVWMVKRLLGRFQAWEEKKEAAT